MSGGWAHARAIRSPLALLNDYDVMIGVANMLDRYRDRVIVAELNLNEAVDEAAP